MTRKMKDSGVEWIGEIPEDWNLSLLSKLSNIKTGSTPDSKFLSDFGEIDWLKTNNLNEEQGTSSSEYKIKEKDIYSVTIAPEKSTLVACIGDIGKMAYTNKPASYNQQINAVIFNDDIDPKFGFYALFAQKEQHKSLANGNVLQILNSQRQGQVKIAFPTKDKQTYIANLLDQKTKGLETIKNTIKREIHLLKEYKQSIITETVTKGLDKDVEMKDSGIEWIGEIPKHWEIEKLKYLVTSITKGISPKYVEEKLTPVVNQATFSKGFFDYNLKYCSDGLENEGRLQKNDVLIATTGGGVLGKTYFFTEGDNYVASTDVAYVRTDDYNISKLIYYFISSNYDLMNGEFGQGSTNQTHLQMDLFSNMYVATPPDNELINIIEYLDNINLEITKIIRRKQKQLEKLEEYKKSLIYEYVTGKREVPCE